MNKIHIPLLIICLFVMVQNAYAQGDVKHLKIEAEARDSIMAITRRIERNPNDGKLYGYRSYYKGLLKDYVGAIDDTRKQLKLIPDNLTGHKSLIYLVLGDYLREIEDYTGAIREYNLSLELIQTGEAYFSRGRAKYALSDYLGAYQDYNTSIEKALNAEFKNTLLLMEAYYNRGIVQVYHLNNKMSGCLDLSKSGELGYVFAYDVIKERCN